MPWLIRCSRLATHGLRMACRHSQNTITTSSPALHAAVQYSLPVRLLTSLPDNTDKNELVTTDNEAHTTNSQNADNTPSSAVQVQSPVGQPDLPPPADVVDYSYFKRVVDAAAKVDRLASVVNIHEEEKEIVQKKEKSDMSARTKSMLKPKRPTQSASLVPYVNDSEVLQKLVQLGADLSRMEQKHDISNHLLKCDFDTDIKPRIMFLSELGVPHNKLGLVITRHPNILVHDMDHMRVRVQYFESKNFSPEAIARIVTMAPAVLGRSTAKIDAHLGNLQKEFKLTGDEVRTVATLCPRLIIFHPVFIKEMKLTLDKFLGFSEAEIKHIAVTHPRIFVERKEAVKDRFDYLHNTMGISHKMIADWSTVLRSRTSVLKKRHLFLKHLGRDQYDPKKENYVSLRRFVTGRDRDFSYQVAKVPVKEFNDFLKTL